MGFPGGTSGKEPTCQCRRHKRHRFDPWVGKIPWRRAWQPTPVFLPGESHGQRRMVGYSSWAHKESDTLKATRVFVNPSSSLHFSADFPTTLVTQNPRKGLKLVASKKATLWRQLILT